ncbi:ABC transporter permease [Litorilinea aerophila]|uniref:ABC transporter permease n=1 Tax=Litorilinea aerophila TaxID=1204385 RepID=A0A540VFU0_9CHLR|nr:ABC transporter permease [Litorilinea aerophila]MCC9076593.1 ABC transporter permease [Litorilinea aerophila]
MAVEKNRLSPEPIQGQETTWLANEDELEELEAPEAIGAEESTVYTASQWQLMWWRFRRHKMAMVSLGLLIFLYLVALFAEVIAPYDPNRYDANYAYAAPQRIHFFDAEGNFHLRPFVYGLKSVRDMETMRLVFEPDTSVRYPLYFFVEGEPYKLWGLFEANIHLFGVKDPEGVFFLLGADRLGRDVFSRIVYGTRISMSVGLVGILISLILGIFFGGISGYYGGFVDSLIQRIIEFLRSIPTIPLWMGLSAAVPKEWSPLKMYFAITVLLSLIGWTGLARVVRGRFLSLREEDFVLAATLAGASELRVIFRHMVPSFLSHIIASLTLSIPSVILAETALSFLGLGLRPPVISWGVLLQESQNLRAVATAPWLLTPGLAVVLAVLAFNFVGDGLRDAADPYAV